jgi:hypothetical protein
MTTIATVLLGLIILAIAVGIAHVVDKEETS